MMLDMMMSFTAGLMLGAGASAAVFGWLYSKDRKQMDDLCDRLDRLDTISRKDSQDA